MTVSKAWMLRGQIGCVLGLTLVYLSATPSAPALLFRALLGAESGRLYAIRTDDNTLRFYWYYPENGGTTWIEGGGPQIGTGWAGFEHVVYNGNGILYGVRPDGHLLYYKDLARNGTFSWANGGTGRDVTAGPGWADYRWVLGDGDGIIYVIDAGGILWFRKHLTQDENATWANGGIPQAIGSGWDVFKRVFPGRGGVIYAIGWDGKLFYYKDLARDGTVNWANGGTGLVIGTGWQDFSFVFSTGNGNIYAVDANGEMLFYHVTVSGTIATWDIGGAHIGSGFVPESCAGYCWPLSAAPGEAIEFKVSSSGRSDVRFFRHKADVYGVVSVETGSTTFVPAVQAVPPEPDRYGCGWSTSFTWTIPSSWPSGIYSARCRYSNGDECHIPFVVKSPARRSCMAILANVNTWLAYNNWGGRSKYDGRAHLSFFRPFPNVSPVSDAFNPRHTARGELWILGALEDAGYYPDVYTDIDFHKGLPAGYKTLVLSTHPEYWSLQMYTNLQSFLEHGGSVLYLGGNGIYENAEYNADTNGMTFLAGVEDGPREPALFRNLVPAKPERALLGVGYIKNTGDAPYEVLQADHPFFRGTGLMNGQTFGEVGQNHSFGDPDPSHGGASGWEVDTRGTGTPLGVTVLATGQNDCPGPYCQGGEMIYYNHPAGGIVFSVGSITFGGSLVADWRIQQILRNAVAEACADCPTLTVLGPPTVAMNLVVRLRGRYGKSYRIESSRDPRPNSWQTVATVSLDSDVVKSVNLRLTGDRLFYRAVQAP